MADLEPGRKVFVRYLPRDGWHARLLLHPATKQTVEEVCEEELEATLEDKGGFWILTPDGDIYPEMIAVPPLLGIIPCDDQERPLPREATPAGSRLARPYDFEPGRGPGVPTPRIFLQLQTAAMNVGQAAPARQAGNAAAAPAAAQVGLGHKDSLPAPVKGGTWSALPLVKPAGSKPEKSKSWAVASDIAIFRVESDEQLYLGTGKTRGLLMVCPALEDYVAAELHRESSAAKERRKMREERQAARAPPGKK